MRKRTKSPPFKAIAFMVITLAFLIFPFTDTASAIAFDSPMGASEVASCVGTDATGIAIAPVVNFTAAINAMTARAGGWDTPRAIGVSKLGIAGIAKGGVGSDLARGLLEIAIQAMRVTDGRFGFYD